jgi:hypothetical protein
VQCFVVLLSLIMFALLSVSGAAATLRRAPVITATVVAGDWFSKNSAQGDMQSQMPRSQLHQSSYCSGALNGEFAILDNLWDLSLAASWPAYLIEQDGAQVGCAA